MMKKCKHIFFYIQIFIESNYMKMYLLANLLVMLSTRWGSWTLLADKRFFSYTFFVISILISMMAYKYGGLQAQKTVAVTPGICRLWKRYFAKEIFTLFEPFFTSQSSV